MKKIEKLGAKIITDVIIGTEFGWPPDCYGIFCQPERPVLVSRECNMRKDSEENIRTNN